MLCGCGGAPAGPRGLVTPHLTPATASDSWPVHEPEPARNPGGPLMVVVITAASVQDRRGGRPAPWNLHRAWPIAPRLGEADLLCLQGGVPEGGNSDQLVALPVAGLAKVEVERLSCRGKLLCRRVAPFPR